jgi:hypothetical protein
MLTVFLSSTTKDLQPARDSAFRAIQGLEGYHCVRMEDFGPVDDAPDDFCRAKVAECDLMVCIVGPLYGSQSPTGLSFTEREFDAAIDARKTCLRFITSDDYPLAANLIEADQYRERQLEFRKKVATGTIFVRFSSPDELSAKVVQGIRNWEARQAENRPSQEALLASQIRSVSYRVAVMNESPTVSDEEVRAAVTALQTQINRDLVPIWGVGAELAFVARGADAPAGSWRLVVEDNSRFPGVVSYHTLTQEGLPEVRVAVREAKGAGWPWTMAASHDLMEMLANPRLNVTIFDSADGRTGKLYIREICDSVSSSKLAYKIDGVTVSDFVYPAWFESSSKGDGVKFDHCGHLNAPFQVAPGSYIYFSEVSESSGRRWHYEPERVSQAKEPTSKRKAGKAAKKVRR